MVLYLAWGFQRIIAPANYVSPVSGSDSFAHMNFFIANNKYLHCCPRLSSEAPYARNNIIHASKQSFGGTDTFSVARRCCRAVPTTTMMTTRADLTNKSN